MNVRRSLMNELSGATRSADLTYAQQIAENDERQFQQEQSLRDSNTNFLSTIAQMAIDNPRFSRTDIKYLLWWWRYRQ